MLHFNFSGGRKKLMKMLVHNQQRRNFLAGVLTVVLFLLGSVPGADSDLGSDRAVLVTLQSAVGGRTRMWNLTQTDPCSWVGVFCSGGRVTELRLPGQGLTGKLPLGLGNLTQLESLSLRFNALSGSVPADLENLVNLRNVYLNGNFFSGGIPEFIFNIQSLNQLNLAFNNFSGEISPRFNNLTKLDTLYLENNSFTGSIPEIDLPGLGKFNVSYNLLNGSIPSKLARFEASAFEGNSLCGKPLTVCNGTENGGNGKSLSGGAIAGIVIGCFFGLLLIVVLLIFLCKKSKSSSEEKSFKETTPELAEIGIPSGKNMVVESGSLRADISVSRGNSRVAVANKSLVFFGNAVRVFDLEDLLRASAEVLGKGTFGTAYKATLEMGIAMAVKRLREVAVQEEEFRENMEKIGRIDHENLVPLRAYYYNRDEKLLVYDFMPMGSLSALLHGNRGAGRTPLNWETRSSIALGAARGIAYLHARGPLVSHGNIKSSNVLLTRNYEARVSDFGLAHIATPMSTRVAGYRAPEVIDLRKVSQKADVYSFGVLLLELLTGKPPAQSQLNEEGVDLPKWVLSVVQEEWTAEVFDLELLRYQNVEEEMVELLQLALECTAQHPDKRPSMANVTNRIEELCPSTLQAQEQNAANDVAFIDTEEGISQQYHSTDSFGRPPSVKS